MVLTTSPKSNKAHHKTHHLLRIQEDHKTEISISSASNTSTGTSSLELRDKDKEQLITLEIIGISLAFTALIVCGLIWWMVVLRKKRKKRQ